MSVVSDGLRYALLCCVGMYVLGANKSAYRCEFSYRRKCIRIAARALRALRKYTWDRERRPSIVDVTDVIRAPPLQGNSHCHGISIIVDLVPLLEAPFKRSPTFLCTRLFLAVRVCPLAVRVCRSLCVSASRCICLPLDI
jgi:hypothetical protein